MLANSILHRGMVKSIPGYYKYNVGTLVAVDIICLPFRRTPDTNTQDTRKIQELNFGRGCGLGRRIYSCVSSIHELVSAGLITSDAEQ